MPREEFKEQAREYAARLYGYGDLVEDNDDRIDQAIEIGETPEYWVEYLAEKYNLTRTDGGFL